MTARPFLTASLRAGGAPDQPAAGAPTVIGSGTRTRSALILAVPALLAGVYLLVLLVDLKAVITSVNTYGDAVIAPVLAKLSGQAPPGSQVVLGHHPYYEEFLFLRATAGLPFYRFLWDVTPFLWTLLGVGMLAWSAWRALGRLAAVLSASAFICLGALGRFVFFSFNWHGLTVVHTILIGCALVWLAPRAAEIGWRRLVTLAVVMGVLSALPAASDVLFLVWALVPMLIAGVVLSYLGEGRARRTPAVFALITVLVSVLAGAAIDHVMRASGVTARQFPFSVAVSAGTVIHNLGLLGRGLIALGGGDLTTPQHGFLKYPGLVNGILLAAAMVLVLLGAGRLAARAARRHGLRSPSWALNQPSAQSLWQPRRAYLVFWTSSLVVTCVAYVASSVPKNTTDSSRYVLAAYVAIMALFPLMALRGRRWRRSVTAGVCVFIVSAIVALGVRPPVRFGPYPTPAVASRVLAFARAHDASYGYASYWDAPAITWMTDFRLKLYPVAAGCLDVTCPFRTARISSWYRPTPGTRSMLIANPAVQGIKWLDPRLGVPLASTRIGRLTVAVYPYDIASKLRRPVIPEPAGPPLP